MKTTKRIFLKTAGALLLAAMILVSGCRNDRIDLIVDNYIEFLEITPEQEPEARRILGDARGIFDKYYAKLDDAKAAGTRITDKMVVDGQISMMNELHETLKEMQRLLTDNQQEIFLRSELYYFYNETRSDLARDISLSDEYDILTYERMVYPGLLSATNRSEELLQRPGAWSIYFGQSVMRGVMRNISNSLSSNARNFPIGIQATLVNNYGQNAIAGEQFTEVRAVVQSRLHPDYTNIDRWVVYLETSGGLQTDPVRIEPVTKEWFVSEGLLNMNEMPEFITEPVAFRGGMERRESRMGRGPVLERPFTGRNNDRQEMFRLSSGYYRFFFPYKLNGTPIISPQTEWIKIVFLEEIGSKEYAEGVWHLQWDRISEPGQNR